jgi:large subunit ribosomal protein L13
MKTYIPKIDEIKRRWYLVDAEGKVLGRLAVKIAQILSGKNKLIYTPHLDVGDFVVVINAKKVRVTGNKEEKKIYYHHSGYSGGLKSQTYEELLEKNPQKVIREAVKGMLPKNRLGRKMLKKLKIYPYSKHPHQAQQLEKIELL